MFLLGYESIVPTFWWGVAVKTGTPANVVDKLHTVINAAITTLRWPKSLRIKGLSSKRLLRRNSRHTSTARSSAEQIMREAGMSAD